MNNNINNNFKTNWIPVVTYNNPHLDKFKFYTDIVKKSGIYISVNNIYNKKGEHPIITNTQDNVRQKTR